MKKRKEKKVQIHNSLRLIPKKWGNGDLPDWNFHNHSGLQYWLNETFTITKSNSSCQFLTNYYLTRPYVNWTTAVMVILFRLRSPLKCKLTDLLAVGSKLSFVLPFSSKTSGLYSCQHGVPKNWPTLLIIILTHFAYDLILLMMVIRFRHIKSLFL